MRPSHAKSPVSPRFRTLPVLALAGCLCVGLLLGASGLSTGCKDDEAAESAGSPATAPAPGGSVAGEGKSAAEPEPAGPQPSATSRALGRQFPPGRNCTVEAVQTAVRKQTAAVRECYQKALLRSPDLAGAVRTQIVVNDLGRATALKVAEDTTGDKELTSCILAVLREVSYAPSPEGQPCTIVYPFDFQVSPEVREQLRARKAAAPTGQPAGGAQGETTEKQPDGEQP